MPENQYVKVPTIVVNDVPAEFVEDVLACLKKDFATYETGKGDTAKVRETSFCVAGKGEFLRIINIGRLGQPLCARMEAYAAGVMRMLSQNTPDPVQE